MLPLSGIVDSQWYLCSMDSEATTDLPDQNLFMMCSELNPSAFVPMPAGYHVRSCQNSELALWLEMPFDDADTATRHRPFMLEFFDRVYAPLKPEFFRRCKFICDSNDTPVGTGFTWRVYGSVDTVHWIKVRKHHEGKGLGRALLSEILREQSEYELPLFLHTQPTSYRAIKLYSDFGFVLLTNPVIGTRTNHLSDCMPYLEEQMTPSAFRSLRTESAPAEFLERFTSESHPEF